MESQTSELAKLPPPPRVIQALINGFNAIASSVVIILIPASVDFFLWLGPRIKADALIAPFMEILPQLQAQAPADQVQLFTQLMLDLKNGMNLFWVFRTFPLGIFSLMSTSISPDSPFGLRTAFNLPGWSVLLGILVLTFLGWLGGGFYFRTVSRIALKLHEGPGLSWTLFQGILLSLFWFIFFMIATIPLLIVLGLMNLLGSFFSTLMLVVLAVPAVWMLLVIYYSFYGIFALGQNALASTKSSFRILRYGLPPLGWFTILTLLISQGMDLLWRSAPTNSWMMGIGILGHAFVSTSLLSAGFIYFRDLNIWIESTLSWIDNQKKSTVQV